MFSGTENDKRFNYLLGLPFYSRGNQSQILYMIANKKLVIGLSILCSILSCNQNARVAEDNFSTNDSVSNEYTSSSAAIETNKDLKRKFIRTAELKFKVKSVTKSTYDIETITNRHGGFVTYSNLSSKIDNVTNTAISADSSLETTYYTVTNSSILRVPNTKLDTTLKEISNYVDYLDYRIIKADDVALQLLSNNLMQKRASKNEARLTKAIEQSRSNLSQRVTAEEVLQSNQANVDDASISNLSLKDQIDFSTIQLSIYQQQTVNRELISNHINIEAYEPGFGTKLLGALRSGWNIIESLIILLSKLWGLVLIAIITYFIIKIYRYKFK